MRATRDVNLRWLGVIALLLVTSCTARHLSPRVTMKPTIITAESLAQPVHFMPWLSEPGSRLAVNPTVGNQAKFRTPATVPGLPMSLAYFVGQKPVTMPGFWSWDGAVPRVDGDVVMVPTADLTEVPAEWRAEGATIAWNGDAATLTIAGGGAVGFMEYAVPGDGLDRRWLIVDVPTLPEGVAWAAKVNDAAGGEDIFVQRDTRQTGHFVFDLTTVAGFRRGHAFNVRFFAVGKPGQAVTFKGLALWDSPADAPLVPSAVMWSPHRVTAHGSAGDLEVESAIAFTDLGGVAQCLTVKSGAGALTLSGEAPGARIAWDDQRKRLRIVGDGFTATVAVSRYVAAAVIAADRRSAVERLSAPKDGPASCWSLRLTNVNAGDRIVVSATFDPPAEGVAERLGSESEAMTPEAFDRAVARRAQEWSERLSRVPRPNSFDLTAIDPKGVTSEQVRQTYYKAWAFIFATALPPMPENDYPYPQVACGKPSTWDEGHERASASAQWESMIGIQLLALVDPETAWQSFEGMMSLVDERGMMGGEGLPSRHAQTAWVLYDLTKDRERLRKTYAPLKRMLLWKIADPRWIYHGLTGPGQKDAEFVAHALLDIGYAQRIATALDMPDEHAFWEQQAATLANHFKTWFWDKPGGVPFRIYEASTGKRADRGGSWTLQALALPPTRLGEAERDSLLKLLRAQRKTDRPFLIPNLTKHATYLLTARGMLQYGTRDEAIEMLEAATRDVIRAGEFAEWYEQGDEPTPAGVTPSIFGAAMVIDGWLLRNGVSIGDGRAQRTPQLLADGAYER